MTIQEIKQILEGKMDQSISSFMNNLSKIRTGRANPALLDTLHVDYYGAMLPLSQVANLSLIDSRTIGIQPWEKGMGAKIEKAIAEKAYEMGKKAVEADKAALVKEVARLTKLNQETTKAKNGLVTEKAAPEKKTNNPYEGVKRY